MAWKKIKLDEEVTFWLLRQTLNQVLRLAILKSLLRRKEKKRTTTTTTSLSRNRNTGCNEWQITNVGTFSRKEHKYSSFCQSSKRCEQK